MRHAVGVEVGQHRVPLATPGLGDPAVALLVAARRLPGRDPAAADPLHGTVHVEHLEHRLEPVAAQLDLRLEAAVRIAPPWASQGTEVWRTTDSGGKASEAKYAQMSRSSRCGMQDDGGLGGATPGAADLLVVGHRRGRTRRG